eukprot:Clim_evm109s128 gene=Clim_evmTU109s128
MADFNAWNQPFGMSMGRFSSGFDRMYKVRPVAMHPDGNKDKMEEGGKIILPATALEILTMMHIDYPMQFKLTYNETGRSTHAGVLDFTADDGFVYIPYWMMENMGVEMDENIQVKYQRLPLASFCKIQPQSVDFLDISNPRAVLEAILRDFSCLTVDDVIALHYNNKKYMIKIIELKPAEAVSIVETNVNVEFMAPVGYKDPAEEKEDDVASSAGASSSVMEQDVEDETWKPFMGQGQRLDAKKKANKGGAEPTPKSGLVPPGSSVPKMRRKSEILAAPYQFGKLVLFRPPTSRKRTVSGMSANSSVLGTSPASKSGDHWDNLQPGRTLK